MRRRHGDERIEPAFGAGVVVRKGRCLERVSSPPDAERPAQQLAEPRREDGIAAVDGVLDVAQEMGEADLMACGQILLAGVALGDPDRRAMVAEHVLGDRFRPARRDLVQNGGGRDEHPVPVGGAIDPGRGFVRADHPGGQQLFLDGPAGRCHRTLRAPKSVGDGAFGHLQPEQLGHHPRQPLEADVMAVVQVQKQRSDRRTERRPGRHAVRRGGTEPLAAAGAAAAVELDPGDMRANRRNLDVLVSATPPLDLSRNVGRAAGAGFGEAPDRRIRGVGHDARHAGTRRPRLPPLAALPLGLAWLLVLRGRRVAVLRGLLRLGQQRLELLHPRRQPRDQRRLLGQKRVLLPIAQAIPKRRSHPYLDSHPPTPRNRKNANSGSSYRGDRRPGDDAMAVSRRPSAAGILSFGLQTPLHLHTTPDSTDFGACHSQ